MAFLYLLNQKDVELAAAEAKASAFGWGWWEHKEKPLDGTLLLDTRRRPAHLALTRRVIKVLASCSRGNLRTTLSALRYPVARKTYRVVLTKQTEGPENEREIATIIWRTIREPKVDLERPQVVIDVVLTSTSAHIGVRIWENEEEFAARRAHLRPELHPSSMHPGLARALVNLACARSVHDAFCGSGGTIIEAGLAHRRVSGGDIDADMVAMARKNCVAYGLHPELRVADAMEWIPRCGAVVSDLPYGKNTSPVRLQPLLEAFLLRAHASTSRCVIGLPHAAAFPREWRVRAHFTSYVHKSMTKHFYVLDASEAATNA